MNTRRSVWLRNSSGGTSAGAPEPGTPSAFFLRSRRRVSSTAAVVANRERNSRNRDTDALGDESPYGLAVARIRVVLEHAEVAQRQNHASGRERVCRRAPRTDGKPRARCRYETVARHHRPDGHHHRDPRHLASRATHGVFPAVAPARSRERALLPRERSVREWQDALAGAGACGGEEGDGSGRVRSCQRRGCRTRGQSGGRRARESVRNGERRRKHARSARAHRFVCRAGHPGRGAEPRRPPRPALATRLDTLSWSVNRNPTVFFARMAPCPVCIFSETPPFLHALIAKK